VQAANYLPPALGNRATAPPTPAKALHRLQNTGHLGLFEGDSAETQQLQGGSREHFRSHVANLAGFGCLCRTNPHTTLTYHTIM
jgi:hypothetical protein